MRQRITGAAITKRIGFAFEWQLYDAGQLNGDVALRQLIIPIKEAPPTIAPSLIISSERFGDVERPEKMIDLCQDATMSLRYTHRIRAMRIFVAVNPSEASEV